MGGTKCGEEFHINKNTTTKDYSVTPSLSDNSFSITWDGDVQTFNADGIKKA